MLERRKMYDVLGIGFGPANIALAAAIEETAPGLDILFLERRDGPAWQPGMLLDNSNIQNHPLRDLATPRNPKSQYSFTNFLFENRRLFEYLNLGMLMPFRTEYAQYITWVADQLCHYVRYGSNVERIEYVPRLDQRGAGYRVHVDGAGPYYARSLVVAPGRTPYVPAVFGDVLGKRVVHLVEYLDAIARVAAETPSPRIAVVGGSQSAVEIILHLNNRYSDATVVGFLRTFGYRLKDTSPFTGEVYFPAFQDQFFHASRATKKRLQNDLRLTNYSASDADVLDELYRAIYQQSIAGKQRVQIVRSADIAKAALDGQTVSLEVLRDGQPQIHNYTFDLVVLATGFRDIGPEERDERIPPILHSLSSCLRLDEHGCVKVRYDYSLELESHIDPGAPCFLNGLCESSHGMGDAGSFSLLSLRAMAILNGLAECGLRARPLTAGPLRRTGT